ncbi:hypothetical protein [Palleronia abyssalis]|uniref:Uncharacterized protein n=1 Tax=Palleronia abyssalis TaxID=1501240 RepID=A0A2R8BZ70_9RHOB|nr:hypothetical protein [Palleronia abyssalis]SPJ25471.1 hypothetical protein PAA8504_03322 [Palleronia abyssalis]
MTILKRLAAVLRPHAQCSYCNAHALAATDSDHLCLPCANAFSRAPFPRSKQTFHPGRLPGHPYHT